MSLPISGLNLTRTGNRTLSIGAGQCKDTTDTKVLQIAAGSTVDIDADSTGINGLDTGTIAASTAYSVWVVKGSGNVGGLLSASFDAASVSFPSGTTAVRRVGTVITDSAGTPALIPFGQAGGSNERKMTWTTAASTRKVLDKGKATSWTAVDISSLVGPEAHTAHLHLKPEATTLELAEGGTTTATVSTDSPIDSDFWMGQESGELGYRIDPGTGQATIVVNGFTETV